MTPAPYAPVAQVEQEASDDLIAVVAAEQRLEREASDATLLARLEEEAGEVSEETLLREIRAELEGADAPREQRRLAPPRPRRDQYGLARALQTADEVLALFASSGTSRGTLSELARRAGWGGR